MQQIRDEIGEHGPITFARFMEIALYDPERGYYRSELPRPGRAGDFLTAPEAHPIFGRALARFVAAVHRALGSMAELTIREYGAGVGALAEPLVGELADGETRTSTDGPGPTSIRYAVNEVDPRRTTAVRDRLDRLELARGVTVVTEPDDGRSIDGVAIANEVLDALPTHRVVQRNGTLREVFVGVGDGGELVDVEADPSTPALAARLAAEGIALSDGQHAEICLAIDVWVADAARGLRNGVLLILDYGHPAAELYDPRRRTAGTLMAYQGHRVGDDPYRAVGRQDLTAHVDLTAVTAAATHAGLSPLGRTTQAEFLAALGIGDLLVAEQTRAGATLQRYLEARSAVIRMIDPVAMGRFRVIAFGAGSLSSAELPGLGATAGSPRTPISDAPATLATD